jgi:hypothetical protein
MVYLAGTSLVLVHFDQGIRFKGLISCEAESSGRSGSLDAANLKRPTTPALHGKAVKEKQVDNSMNEVAVEGGQPAAANSAPIWSIEPAMYRSINLGVNLGEPRSHTDTAS